MRQVLLAFVLTLLTVSPLSSQTKNAASWIDVKGYQGSKLRAWVFRPPGPGPFPVVVWLHGADGLIEENMMMSSYLASKGFLTLMGCYFGQTTRPTGAYRCPETPGLDKAFLSKNAAALIEAAQRLPAAAPGKVGLVGRSLGGGLAALIASSGANVQAVVSLSGVYEILLGAYDDSPISLVKSLRGPILIMHGTKDDVVPVSSARKYEMLARQLGKNVQAIYYDGGGHFLPSEPRYVAKVQAQIVEFLRRQLR